MPYPFDDHELRENYESRPIQLCNVREVFETFLKLIDIETRKNVLNGLDRNYKGTNEFRDRAILMITGAVLNDPNTKKGETIKFKDIEILVSEMEKIR